MMSTHKDKKTTEQSAHAAEKKARHMRKRTLNVNAAESSMMSELRNTEHGGEKPAR